MIVICAPGCRHDWRSVLVGALEEDVLTSTVHSGDRPLIEAQGVSLWYGEKQALDEVSLDVHAGEVLAFIGPSGCGKTTMLKCFNLMHLETPGVRMAGKILLNGLDIYDPEIDPTLVRRRFGWVAQRPNPFPSSVYENVAYGLRLHGLAHEGEEIDSIVEASLRKARLWGEVKDDVHRLQGTDLSVGQQQRLCIARALAIDPDVLLMDEPTGSIDPIATAAVEELIVALRAEHTIVVVTHSMMQARRIADRVAYFHLGRLLEVGPTRALFENAQHDLVRRFIAGKFG